MKYRTLALLLALLAVAVVVNAPLAAEDKDAKNTHEGTFVKAEGDQFTMKDKDGKEHSHNLATEAKVFRANGKECKITDLKKGQRIRVTTKPDDMKVATKVEVLRKKK